MNTENLRSARVLLGDADAAMIKAARLLQPVPKTPPVMAGDRHLADALRELTRARGEPEMAATGRRPQLRQR